MSDFTRLTDTLASSEGVAFITIDGQTRKLFEVSAIDGKIEFRIQKRFMMGHRMEQAKIIGAKGTGTCTLYLMHSMFLEMALDYINEGKYPNITLQITNEDPQSTIGRQTVALGNVVFESLPFAKLDDQSEDPITIETNFSFSKLQDIEKFQLPENQR